MIQRTGQLAVFRSLAAFVVGTSTAERYDRMRRNLLSNPKLSPSVRRDLDAQRAKLPEAFALDAR